MKLKIAYTAWLLVPLSACSPSGAAFEGTDGVSSTNESSANAGDSAASGTTSTGGGGSVGVPTGSGHSTNTGGSSNVATGTATTNGTASGSTNASSAPTSTNGGSGTTVTVSSATTGTSGSSATSTSDTGGNSSVAEGTGSPVVGATDPLLACTREFTMPTAAELTANPKLPDPFTFLDGSKVASVDDWVCRQKEISLLAQEFIYGRKPPAPESVEGSFSNGKLTVTVTDGGRSIEFTATISGGSGDGLGPAVFDLGGAPSGVATIAYSSLSEEIAKSGSGRGTSGKFYDLYPDYDSTGSLMAWAWGASRIVDALEKTTGHNIDTNRLSAMGCSRNGKAAATIALFDSRFSLVAAMSPGSGTTSAWRVAQAVNDGDVAAVPAGDRRKVQTASQIYGENTWLGEVFQPFGGNNVTKLPVDQHEVLALAWPRGLIMMEGDSDYWNCPYCSYTTLKYTQMVYEALGTPDSIAFPQADYGHCAQDQGSRSAYTEFVDFFLKDDTAADTSGKFNDEFYTFDADLWQDGDVPTLP